jgi:hypothetical protein
MDMLTVRQFRRAKTTNSSGGFTAKVPVLIKPANDGVIDLVQDGNTIPGTLKIMAVGVGSDNDAMAVRLWGWTLVGGPGATLPVWVPVLIAELNFVLSTTVGVAGTVVPATERIADTVTIVTEASITAATTRQGEVLLTSPATQLPALALVPLRGFELVEFDFDDTVGTPTMNALFAGM